MSAPTDEERAAFKLGELRAIRDMMARRWPDPSDAEAQRELAEALHEMHEADTACFHGHAEPDCVVESRWLIARLGEPS